MILDSKYVRMLTKEIKERIVPELNEDFYKDLGSLHKRSAGSLELLVLGVLWLRLIEICILGKGC